MSHVRTELQAVIFDMDGVLIDSSDAHFESWRQLGADLGAGVTRERFAETFGRQNRDVIPELFGIDDPPRVHELGERKERYYRDIISGHVPGIPGAAALVRECVAAGLRCAVGSSGHPENITVAVRALGLESHFAAVVTGHDVTAGKPDPQVFLLAAERMNVPAIACVVIEDAPAGIEAALRADMIAVGITTSHPKDRLSCAHHVVDQLGELSPLVLRRLAAQASTASR